MMFDSVVESDSSGQENADNEEIKILDETTPARVFEGNDFIIGKMTYNFGTHKEMTCLFVGHVEDKSASAGFIPPKKKTECKCKW